MPSLLTLLNPANLTVSHFERNSEDEDDLYVNLTLKYEMDIAVPMIGDLIGKDGKVNLSTHMAMKREE